MSKRFSLLIVIFLAAALVVITSCNMPKVKASLRVAGTATQITPTPSPTPTLMPCGTNFQCLIAAARKCEPQTGILSVSVDMGVRVKFTYEFTIKGKVGDKCAFGVRVQNISVEYTKQTAQQMNAQGLSAAQIEQRREQIVSRIKASTPNGTCEGSGEALANLLAKWRAGNFSMDDWRAFQCQGQGLNRSPATPPPVKP